MAEDSAMREGSLPVSWGESSYSLSKNWLLSLTLLFSDPARSTKFILPVNAEIESSEDGKAREENERTNIGDRVYYASFYSQDSMGTRGSTVEIGCSD